MNIGTLRDRCRIERHVVGTDPVWGTPLDTWETLAEVWCNVQDELPSRSEALKNGLSIATSRARLRIRYRTDIDSAMRVVLLQSGQVYQIIAGPAVLGVKDGLEMMIERYSS